MLTSAVVESSESDMPLQTSQKALYLLKENIRTLLYARKENQVTLATWVGHSKAWINKFLSPNEPDVEIQLKDLDRIADFFGIATYQLFQPGINRLTERRLGGDRRAGLERRIGHDMRTLETLRVELNKHPRLASSPGGSPHAPGQDVSVPKPVQNILAEAERQIAAYYAAAGGVGQQTASPRRRVSRASKNHRDVRGPAPKTA